jgi:hypothetical protein
MGVTPIARRITPPRIAAVNSVARNDWTLYRVTMMPFTTPMATPKARLARMP